MATGRIPYTVEILPHRYRVTLHYNAGDEVQEGRKLFIAEHTFFKLEGGVHKIKGHCFKMNVAKDRNSGITKIYLV